MILFFGCNVASCQGSVEEGKRMIETLPENIIYYGAALVATFGIIAGLSVFLGGSFAGDMFIIILGMILFEFLDSSLYDIVIVCILANLVLRFSSHLIRGKKYSGRWHALQGDYRLNITETAEEIAIETNFFYNFTIEMKKNSIDLISGKDICTIKKHGRDCLEIKTGKTKILMKKQEIPSCKGFMGIITARQQAVLGITLGAVFAVVYTWTSSDLNEVWLLEDLLSHIVRFSFYGFGYIFLLNFFEVLQGIIFETIGSVISCAVSVPLLTLFIALVIILFFVHLAFIPGMFMGIKLILDECAA